MNNLLLVFCLLVLTLSSVFGQENILQKEGIPLDPINPNLKDTIKQVESYPDYAGIFTNFVDNRHSITDKQLDKSVVTDATRLMQSQVAGLSVLANTYSPGGSSRILLRGNRTIHGDNQPLILLNGIPIENSEWNNGTGHTDQSNRLMDIDPNTIQSIDITKSAAGRAKYGTTGANGVISITTKQGARGRPRFTLTSSISQSNVSNLPALQDAYAQGRTDTNGEPYYRGPEFFETFSWGPHISMLKYQQDPDYPFDDNGRITGNLDVVGADVNPYDPYTLFNKTLESNLSLGINGGNNRVNYHIQGSINNQPGIIPSTKYNRYNLSASANARISDALSMQVNTILSASEATRNQKGANLSGIMLGLLRTPTTFDNSNGLSEPISNEKAYVYDNIYQRSSSSGLYDNPYWSLNKNPHINAVNRQLININTTYKVNSATSVLLNIGHDRFTDNRRGGIDINPNFGNGSAYDRTLDFASTNADIAVTHHYNKFNKVNISATLGGNYLTNTSTYALTEGRNLLTSDNVSIENTTINESLNYTNQFKRAGALINLDIDYNDYLSLTGSLRQDYTNKFGSNTNGFTSYGIGFGLSVLKLMNSDDQVNSTELLITGSVGRFGNTYWGDVASGRFVQGGVAGDGWITLPELPELTSTNNILTSNNLTAESTKAADIGLVISVFDKLASLGFTYYSELSEGMIIVEEIASSTGFDFLQSNNGTMTNKGIELYLTAKPIDTKSVSWLIDASLNKNINKVSQLGQYTDIITLNGFNSVASIAMRNQPYGVIYGTAFQQNASGQTIIGQDGYPLIASESRIIADPNPDWTLYLTNTLQLGKSLSITGTLDLSQGGELYCGTCASLDYLGRSQLSADERGTTTVFEGVTSSGAANTKVVELTPANSSYQDYYRVRYGFNGVAAMHIYDASWVRLRNVSLQYDLGELFDLKFVQGIELGIYAENLIVFTDYPSFDPEQNLQGNSGGLGIEYFNNPGIKRYGLSLQATF